jgi:hypothetical protein
VTAAQQLQKHRGAGAAWRHSRQDKGIEAACSEKSAVRSGAVRSRAGCSRVEQRTALRSGCLSARLGATR